MTTTHIISLGAGVQSSTMALMTACGEITPMPAAAVFADTQAEPAGVYSWLDWLEKQLPFPGIRISRGSLEVEASRVRISKTGNFYQKHTVPAFTREAGKPSGLLMRQCTTDFKIEPLIRKAREIRGVKTNKVIQWIGISTDEFLRMKPPRKEHAGWLKNRWPLIEAGVSRQDCLNWMAKKGFPKPPRSACVFCPYHSDAEWLRLKQEEPEEFERAAVFEERYKSAFAAVPSFRGEVFLHRSLRPLREVTFKTDKKINDAFNNECEGMCGL